MPDKEATQKAAMADSRTQPARRSPGSPDEARGDATGEPVPAVIGKYQVVKPLSQGGMGRVYLCRHPDLDVEIVVKTIHARYAENAEYRARFLCEGRIAAKLRVPNVAQIFDAGEDGEGLFIAQEYVQGGDALQAMEKAPGGILSAERALDIVIDVCKALCAAHDLGIIHRDVKPENILLTPEGEAKLADFGLAAFRPPPTESPAAAGSTGRLTETFAGMGSPHYAAPEQATDARHVDIRADIYSLGATFYHLVTGKTPFTGKTAYELFMRHAHDLPVDPCKANPALRRGVGRAIRKMMAKDPARRYQAPRDLLADLEALRRPHAKPWKAPAVAALVTAAAAFAIAVMALLAHRSSDATELRGVQADIVAERYAQALSRLEPLLQTKHPRPEALYAAGLCQIGKGDLPGLAATRDRLEAARDGREWAAHLDLLEQTQAGHTAEAWALVNAWEGKAKHVLSFRLSKALLLLQEDRLPEAREALKQGLQGSPFLDFQRYLALDTWAKLFAGDDRFAEAEAAYASGLQHPADAALASPAFLTNYAATLLALGKKDKATEMVDVALHVEPQDVVAQYLKMKVNEKEGSQAREQAQYVTTLIGEIDALARAKASARDTWSTSPIVLTFSPFRSSTPGAIRLHEDAAVADLLTTAVRQSGPFPVVDRESLSDVLREHKISVSELGSTAGVLRLGQVLPASVLVRGTLRLHAGAAELTLETIDVQTTEQIGIRRWPLRTAAASADTFGGIALQVLAPLRDWRAPQGRIVTRDGNTAEISNGLCHGLAKGDEVWIYRGDGSVSASMLRRTAPVCKGTVGELDRFTAVVDLGEGAGNVVPGMLTLRASRPGGS
jgi:tetratricopeptide (TPR) repeat protein/tRNA A-37 threonylcarbamoyl transferase component Bud32